MNKKTIKTNNNNVMVTNYKDGEGEGDEYMS